MSRAKRARKGSLTKKILLLLILLVVIVGMIVRLEPNLRRKDSKS